MKNEFKVSCWIGIKVQLLTIFTILQGYIVALPLLYTLIVGLLTPFFVPQVGHPYRDAARDTESLASRCYNFVTMSNFVLKVQIFWEIQKRKNLFFRSHKAKPPLKPPNWNMIYMNFNPLQLNPLPVINFCICWTKPNIINWQNCFNIIISTVLLMDVFMLPQCYKWEGSTTSSEPSVCVQRYIFEENKSANEHFTTHYRAARRNTCPHCPTQVLNPPRSKNCTERVPKLSTFGTPSAAPFSAPALTFFHPPRAPFASAIHEFERVLVMCPCRELFLPPRFGWSAITVDLLNAPLNKGK